MFYGKVLGISRLKRINLGLKYVAVLFAIDVFRKLCCKRGVLFANIFFKLELSLIHSWNLFE